MKILTNKRYEQLLYQIDTQLADIDDLESENKALREWVAKFVSLEVKSELEQKLKDARNQISNLQASLDASEKRVVLLSKENRHLEAEIKRSKNRFKS